MKKEKETGWRGRIDKSIVKASMEVEKNEIESKNHWDICPNSLKSQAGVMVQVRL